MGIIENLYFYQSELSIDVSTTQSLENISLKVVPMHMNTKISLVFDTKIDTKETS